MRPAFVNALIKAASSDPRIFFLTGDLGYNAFEPFQEKFPDRFLNMGVAEQNMAGFAAGLALSGKIPVIYSIATFATLKTLEQMRNDICYQNLNVKLVGGGGGLTYSQYGATHHSTEDIALMRSLPNMKVVCPGDPVEVEKAVPAILNDPGPCYLRIGARGEARVIPEDYAFTLGKGTIVSEGKEVALISTGNMLVNSTEAAKILRAQGITPRIISMHTVKPLDAELLEETFKNFQYVFTIEEHSLIGGLGSAVAEVIAERSEKPFSFRRIALPDEFQKTAGSLEYLRTQNGLTSEAIAKQVLAAYNLKS